MTIEKYIIDKSDLTALLRGEDLAIQPKGNIKGFCVEIAGNLTNGDVIKVMFPNMETEFINQKLIYPNGLYKSELKVKPYNADEDNLVFVLRSLADWWNAPYKAESEYEDEN